MTEVSVRLHVFERQHRQKNLNAFQLQVDIKT